MKNSAPSPLDLNRGVLRKTLSVLAPLFACATLSHATVLLQEDFNSLTTGDLNGQNSWTADAGLDVVAGGQSYNSGTLSISGGANRVQSATPSSGVAAPLATKSFTSQSSEVWMSFTMSISTSVNGDRYWFWLSDTTNINSGFTAAVGDTNQGTKGLYAETRINTTAIASTQTTITEGQVIFLVARLSKDGAATDTNAYDRVELWVNPTSTIIGSATTSVDRTDSVFTGGVVSFGLTVLGTTPTLGWDNLLVGTSQADVLNVYAIPEPSTYAALGGLAALGFTALRRRRA
jgi:hypothetical protein